MLPDSLELLVDGWLESVRVSLLSEWDVLFFLYRHSSSLLVSAGQIALLLGYSRAEVGKALDTLGTIGLVRRSRSSQGARFYNFAAPLDADCQKSLEELLKVAEDRRGRLVLASRLRQRSRSPRSARAGLHLA